MKMPDDLSELTSNLRRRKIEVPESFADDILQRIDQRTNGGFKSLPVSARITLSAIVIALYCSLGILLGIKGYENLRPERESHSNEVLVDLMKSHHMNSDFMQDRLFMQMNTKN